MDNDTFPEFIVDQNQTETHVEAIPGIDSFNNFFSGLVTAFSFLGVLLNLCVIRFSRHLRRSTGDLTHCFVCSMASADLLLCCFAQPFEFVLQKLSLALPEWICRLQHMLYWLGYSASGLSLTMLNLDKLLFFRWPLHYGMLATSKTARFSIMVCWMTCLLGSLSMIVPSILELSPAGDCGTLSISKELYIFYTSAFCILPVLSSAAVSVYLAHLVSSMRRNTQQYSSALFDDHTVQQRLKAMAYIFITTAWTFVALTPFRVFNIVRLYCAHAWYEDRSTLVTVHWLAYIFIYLLAFNPSVNALLTLTTYAQYKNLFLSQISIWGKKLSTALGCRPKMRSDLNDNRSHKISMTQNEWVWAVEFTWREEEMCNRPEIFELRLSYKCHLLKFFWGKLWLAVKNSSLCLCFFIAEGLGRHGMLQKRWQRHYGAYSKYLWSMPLVAGGSSTKSNIFMRHWHGYDMVWWDGRDTTFEQAACGADCGTSQIEHVRAKLAQLWPVVTLSIW